MRDFGFSILDFGLHGRNARSKADPYGMTRQGLLLLPRKLRNGNSFVVRIALCGAITVLACSGAQSKIANPKSKIGSDNELTAKEKKTGWVLLFDGKTLNGWMTSSQTPSRVPVDDGCIQPHGAGGYMMVYEKPLKNFILSMDYKISKGCNSGVFVRTYSLTPRPGKDVGFNGIEIAIDDTYGTDYHDPGAIYDLSKPFKQAQKPAGEWNYLVIRVDGPHIFVDMNKQRVNYVNLDRFTEPNTRPDLTKHKFDIAYKDHPRTGYIGLQDHGSPCWYKNIKMKPLKD